MLGSNLLAVSSFHDALGIYGGGAGTLIGPSLGAGVLQLTGYFLNIWFGPRWPLIFGVVFILIVLFFPIGIVGTWRSKGSTWRTAWRERPRRARIVSNAN